MEIVAETWIKNNIYHIKFTDRDILLSVAGWLSDGLMDAAQKCIFKLLGSLEFRQSVLNWQKNGIPFLEVVRNHIQLLHDGVNHWLLSFSPSGRVQVCHSLHTNTSSVTKSVKALYKSNHSSTRMESSQLQ